jgi:hypothetical protein
MAKTRPKPVHLSQHASRYVQRRGFTEAEVEQAIRQAPWTPARQGRMECVHDFPYNRTWNGRQYATKRVRPIFVEEPERIVVVTVITYFF